ncbi:MFS transporter [Patulibacter brassicae]|uniref:MFS transporter n=1 Tax=Patulibacter brassicae TaxID=1705717 RepID=A0ABU4VK03_9ACTN|nr:MFS transporter [Patulibacter brassicae]MDX8152155.1 MFS transporter [Patulibacter brassicae]
MRSSGTGGRSPATTVAVVVAIVAIALVALNLRPAVVAVGPVADELRDGTGLSSSAVGLLTTLPLICFGLFSIGAPRLGRRIGLEPALLLAVGLIVAGVLARLVPATAALFVGSAIAGAGIAIGNVLLPAVIKRDFADRTGLLMAVYGVALNAGAALAAGLTVPVQHALDLSWRGALAIWLVPAIVAAVAWLPLLRAGRGRPPAGGGVMGVRVWRSSLAWAVATFMGLQSLAFYAMAAWLPTILQDDGVSAATSGLLLSLLSLAATVAAVVVPLVATRGRDQRPIVAVLVVLLALGTGGLVVAPGAGAVAWVLLLGGGMGAALTLAITFFALRTRSAHAAGELSGMAQAVGYLVAATGPTGLGAVHDASGGWTVPLVLLLVLLVPLAVAGWIAAGDRSVERPA